MSWDEDPTDRSLVSKELVKEALQEILNDIPAFRLFVQSSTPKDGGSAGTRNHTERPTRSNGGRGNYRTRAGCGGMSKPSCTKYNYHNTVVI